MSEIPVEQNTLKPVQLLSDHPLSAGAGFNWSCSESAAMWIVEQRNGLDTYDEQRRAVRDGRDVLVCSFLRNSVSSIGACRRYVGSVATVSAAAGISIHCQSDLLRAARELRGRLSAISVSVLDEREVLTVTLEDLSRIPIGPTSPRKLLGDILFDISRQEVAKSSAA